MDRWRRRFGVASAATLVLAACTGGVDPAPSSTAAGSRPTRDLAFSTAGWRTDFSRHEVPLEQIMGGGPPKDGIPAIDEPRFEPIGSVDWLEPAEPVIAVEIDGQARAYPIQILVWHEIVNDELSGMPITVTFCPLCHTAIVFDRRLADQVLDFGTTGNLRFSDLVMYDRQTESWWQQASGTAIVGELSGEELTFLPSQLIGWQQFQDLYPDGEVLSRDTGHSRPYGRNPYPGYDRIDERPFLINDPGALDTRLPPKLRILGVIVDDDAAAYPFRDLAATPVVNDELGGVAIVILYAPGVVSGLGGDTVAGGDEVGSAAAYLREVEGQTLTFEPDGDGMMRDLETGSSWNLSGAAVDGSLAGSRLEPVVADAPFWFAWAVFRPDTRIWGPESDT